MNYSEYTDDTVSVNEYTVAVSDGARLKIIDFVPQGEEAKGPVLIFVAGWISLISGWKGVLREITPLYRTIYVETREKSSSSVPLINKKNFSMERLKLDLQDVISQLIPAHNDYVLAGSSLGASAILEYCADSVRPPAASVLIGPNSEFRFPRILGDIIPLIHPGMYNAVKPVIKWYLKNFRLDKKNSADQIAKYERTLDAADPYKLKANALALKNYRISSAVSNIKTPCLIIGATTDTLHGTENIKKITESIPGAEYIELASNTETHNEKAGRLITDYIKRIEQQSGKK